MKKSCMYALMALTLVAGATLLAACGGGASNGGGSKPTTAPECSTAGVFTFQDGACVAGSGERKIGGFKVTSAWRITWQFDPQCPDTVSIVGARDSNNLAQGGTPYPGQGPYGVATKDGGGTLDFPERSDPTFPADWTLDFGKYLPQSCSWTVTFSSIQ